MTEVGQANESSMRPSVGQNTAQTEERLNDWFGFAWAFQKMTAIPKALGRIAARTWYLEDHDESRAEANEVAMAKVIEFYIPQNFRRTTKWVPDVQRWKNPRAAPTNKTVGVACISGP